MFYEFLKLGFEHILDVNGLDHVLFIVVLALSYTIKEWKQVILLVTAFTIGHSLTLLLSSLDIIYIQSDIIEIGIALSILIVALINIFYTNGNNVRQSLRYTVALLFGLIHGLGFSNFFKMMLQEENILVPLLSFNIGVEIAQLVIVIFVIFISTIATKKIPKKIWNTGLSITIALWAMKMIVERI